MAPIYAKDQPAGFTNKLAKIAIVGAAGQVGSHITREILRRGHQTVTALTRAGAGSTMPAGVTVAEVDYAQPATLVAALRGHDALVITLNVFAPPDTQTTLIDAAAAAGVPWLLPNEWGYDAGDAAIQRDLPLRAQAARTRAHVEAQGIAAVGLACGFWYEYSLAGTVANAHLRYGFDFANKALRLFDDGRTPINTSTWPQVGRGAAALLDLPIHKQDAADAQACLDDFRGGYVYVSSFRLSQRDMLASVLRVTGDRASDWTLTHQPVEERFAESTKEWQGGDRTGFVKALYSRYFYKDGQGDYEGRGLLNNDVLGLPKESLDEFTKISLEMGAK